MSWNAAGWRTWANGLGKWPSVRRKIEKPGHRMAAEIIFFPQTGYGGTILTDLTVIWEMSHKLFEHSR
jgi:hypothetical protein